MNTILSVHRVIPVAALACLLAVTGCGGDEKPDDEALVRKTLTTFAKSVETGDYAKLCNEVFSPELLEGLQSIGYPCEVAMKNSLGEVSEPRLTVGKITVSKDDASAEIKTSAEGQPPSSNTLHLKLIDGAWRVSALTDAALTEEESATPEASADGSEPEAPSDAPVATPTSPG
jgi:hypothetical protein